MNRKTLLTLIATLSMAFITIIAGTKDASAQIPVQMCESGCYTVDLTPLRGFPPDCRPCIQTLWANGVIWPVVDPPCYMPGDSIVECPRGVAPGTPLQRIIVCNGISIPGITGYYTVQCPGCPLLCVVVCLDKRGCLYIKVYPGPCTDQIAMPCP
jgi:hypothetical protein